MTIQLGLERILTESKLKSRLAGRRLGLLAHPASVDQNLNHAIDLFFAHGLPLTCAFGPQHGMKGDKQYNMIETNDEIDSTYKIPVFSLYGEVRRPSAKMMDHLDVLLVDLQDVGCRIYTFLTTLFYILEDAAISKKEVWVLDRPNPAGRPIEGSLLRHGFESFVGAAAVPMRHGLTLGEAALWYREIKKLDVALTVVEMRSYDPFEGPGFGWPKELSWINPSPNMPRLSTARSYAGTVMIEGTLLSEGRGTTIPLEVIGAPKLSFKKIINDLEAKYPQWTKGVKLREFYFAPTFDKYKGELLNGLQLHADDVFYDPSLYKPYRLVSAFLKLVRQHHPEFLLWREPPYEYENVKKPIDIISGSTFLREWVDDPRATAEDLENHLLPDETLWLQDRRKFLLY